MPNAVTFDPLVRLASLFVLGASWMGLWELSSAVTGCHERYTARAGGVWPAAGPEAAGTSDFSCSVREIAAERLIFDRSDQQKPNPRQSYIPWQPPSAPPRHMGGRWWLILGRGLTHGHMHWPWWLVMHLKCCNFRPTGPFGITLRAGCVMDGTVGFFPHCHWLSRTIYGTSWRRMASCWT
jgi:hypothetical protein